MTLKHFVQTACIVLPFRCYPLHRCHIQTVAGRRLAEWLASYDGASWDVYREFSRTTSCRPPARGFQDPSLRDRTGGFELTKIEEETPTKVTALLQERNSDGFSRLTLEVEAAEPYRILKLAMPQVERPAEFALPHLSDDQLVVALRKKLQEKTANERFAGAVLIAKDRKAIFGRAYRIRIRRVAPAHTSDSLVVMRPEELLHEIHNM